MQEINVYIRGTAPLLMHSDKLADPLCEAAKEMSEISSKRKKTDADHRQMALLEWRAGMYHDEELGPYLPAEMLDKMLVVAARSRKRGKDVEAAARCKEDRVKLLYDGPRTQDALWGKQAQFAYRRSVVVSGRRVMRTRPIFRSWEAKYTLVFDEERLNGKDLIEFLQFGGRYCGLGDYRPRFGRFEVVF